LRSINSDEQRLDTTRYCVLHNAFRYGTVFVDVSSEFDVKLEKNKRTCRIQLEELDLTRLSAIDYFVKGTRC
jgi:hypothetical protein